MTNMNFRAVVALLATLVLVGCGSTPWQNQSNNVTQPAPFAGTTSVPATPQSAPVAKASAPQGQDATVALPSTQPFQQFKRGAGEGYAFKYRPRSKEDVVKMLRDPKAQKEMRVSCKVWVTQIAEAHKLPFEGCEGAAAVIEKDSDYKVEKCNDAMFQKNWLLVTNEKGDKFGAWHRKCYPGEKVLTYKGQPISSTECMNPVIPITPVAVSKPVQSPAPAYMCAKKIGEVSVWATDVVAKVPGLADAIAKVRAGKSGYYDPAEVSRGYGARIRAVGTPITSADVVTVKFHRASGGVTELFKGSVVGKQRFELPADAVDADVVQIVFGGLDKYVYPPQDLRGKVSEYKGGCVINASHAILR